MTNQLILGDNLTLMREMASESIDLIYLDPPFFSNRHYETLWGDDGEIRSFEDRWAGGIEHYIAWLKERVFEMHRLLKPTGSIFLHCDWHADAYIRVSNQRVRSFCIAIGMPMRIFASIFWIKSLGKVTSLTRLFGITTQVGKVRVRFCESMTSFFGIQKPDSNISLIGI